MQRDSNFIRRKKVLHAHQISSSIFSRQIRFPHQIDVHLSGSLTAFRNGPHDQGLSPAHVSSSKYIRYIRLVLSVACLVVGTGISVQSQLICQGTFGSCKSKRQQSQITRPRFFQSLLVQSAVDVVLEPFSIPLPQFSMQSIFHLHL